MAGVDTVRGIGYQQAHAVLTALDLIGHPSHVALRVEGVDDVVDIEVLEASGKVAIGKQVKIRDQSYTWGQGELLTVLRRWADLDAATNASFEFVTDGRLGPTVEAVRAALNSAGGGDMTAIAELLNVDAADPVCALFSRSAIRQEAMGVEPILAEAERIARTLLSEPMGRLDLEARARAAVERLLRVLLVRAGAASKDERVMTAREVVEIVGGTDAVPAADRWGLALAAEFTQGVLRQRSVEKVPPILRRIDPGQATDEPDTIEPSELLALAERNITVTGTTGSGKTTFSRLLREEAAGKGRVVVLAHAEAYTPGRLDSLIADALSDAVGRELPSITGRQALADDGVVVVLDGVSEVPSDVLLELARELGPLSVGRHVARLALLGRDRAAVQSAIATSASVTHYSVTSFDRDQQLALAEQVLGRTPEEALTPGAGIAYAREALGDAAGNPMLLTMALQLFSQGVDFRSRSELYQGFVEQMAARSRTAGIALTATALGVVFGELLNEERRYANAYEWDRRVGSACAVLADKHISISPSMVTNSSDRSGLLTRIGHTQTRVPVHDSFADFFAGMGIAGGLAPARRPLTVNDEQRLIFASELGALDAALVRAAADELPFLTPRLARYDRRLASDATPDEVADLLATLSPMSDATGIQLWRSAGRVAASLAPHESPKWISDAAGQELLRRGARTVLVNDSSGPLMIAIRLWRVITTSWMKAAHNGEVEPRPQTAEAAAVALAAHVQATRVARKRLLRRHFSHTAQFRLEGLLSPGGLSAYVYEDARWMSSAHRFSVAYVANDEIDVRAATPDEARALQAGSRSHVLGELHGSAGVEWMLRKTPEASAAEDIKTAINQAAGIDWL